MMEITEDEAMALAFFHNEEPDTQESHILPNLLPILPVRNIVLFPGTVVPITVGRERSIQLVRDCGRQDQIIGVATQRDESVEDPQPHDLYEIGTAARIIKQVVMPNGQITILLKGIARIRLKHFTQVEPYFVASIQALAEDTAQLPLEQQHAFRHMLLEATEKIIQLQADIPAEVVEFTQKTSNFYLLVSFIAAQLPISLAEKQSLLEESQLAKRTTKLLEYLHKLGRLLEIKNEIQKKVHDDLDKQQRDYFLRQQIKILQNELGYEHEGAIVESFRQKAAQMQWSTEVSKHFDKELQKLMRLAPGMPDYGLQLNYLELLLDLPWKKYSTDKLDLKHARHVLDQEHYGLEKVKQRILEFLAVMKLSASLRGPILCLYGPPGVGKTSLGKSIAKALGRKYVRMSLGGLHDEAEIRGHRKTYIGAMPGKLIQLLRRAGTANPVLVLDEIDKIGSDFRGDPAAALLEVLDPEQNNNFTDNFLEVPFDLSQVLFIATANSLDTLHPALRDRMEIIEIGGYTPDEKLEIAKQHLIPKQKIAHGLGPYKIRFREEALRTLIEEYTRESGVRQLEQQIGALMRKIAHAIALDTHYPKLIQPKHVYELLGKPIYRKENGETSLAPGIAIGLAWTPVGGDILYIETILTPGKGVLTLSGRLGEIMKESATTAYTLLKAYATSLRIERHIFEQHDLHIHIPEGAIPKDGPSAGIAIFTALASLFTQRPVQPSLSMTGELTLRGRVLAVGGIKEKLLAAQRAGIRTVILPKENQHDIEALQLPFLRNLEIQYVSHIKEVLERALGIYLPDTSQ